MSAEFEHGIFGCFDNCGLCVITYFLPCYTFGKTAEAVGDSCCLCALMLFVPVGNIIARLSIRGKVRESKGIDGSCLGDLVMLMCCAPCALVQEAQEVQVTGQYISRN